MSTRLPFSDEVDDDTNGTAKNPVEKCSTPHNARFSKAVKNTGKSVRVRYGSRWRKYGNDRVYFDNGDGYVDLQTGAVEGNTPVENVEVVEHEDSFGNPATWVVYYVERGTPADCAGDSGTTTEPAVALER